MGIPTLLPCRPFSSILDRLRGQSIFSSVGLLGFPTDTAAHHLRFVPPSLARAGGAVISENSKLSFHPIPRACDDMTPQNRAPPAKSRNSRPLHEPFSVLRILANGLPSPTKTVLLNLPAAHPLARAGGTTVTNRYGILILLHPRHNLGCCTSSGSCIQSVYSQPAARSPALLPCCPAVCSLPIEVHRPLPCRALYPVLGSLRGQHASSLASYHVSICQPCSITRAACIEKYRRFNRRYSLLHHTRGLYHCQNDSFESPRLLHHTRRI